MSTTTDRSDSTTALQTGATKDSSHLKMAIRHFSIHCYYMFWTDVTVKEAQYMLLEKRTDNLCCTFMLDMPEICLNIATAEFYILINVVKNVMLAPPAEYAKKQEPSVEKKPDTEDKLIGIERDDKFKATGILNVKNVNHRKELEGLMERALGSTAFNVEPAMARYMEVFIGKGTWILKGSTNVVGVERRMIEVGFTGVYGAFTYKEDRRFGTIFEVQRFFARDLERNVPAGGASADPAKSPKAQVANRSKSPFRGGTSVDKAVAQKDRGAQGEQIQWMIMPVLEQAQPCSRCGQYFDTASNYGDSCVFHADAEYEPGVYKEYYTDEKYIENYDLSGIICQPVSVSNVKPASKVPRDFSPGRLRGMTTTVREYETLKLNQFRNKNETALSTSTVPGGNNHGSGGGRDPTSTPASPRHHTGGSHKSSSKSAHRKGAGRRVAWKMWSCCGDTNEHSPGCKLRPHMCKELMVTVRAECRPSARIDNLEMSIIDQLEISIFPGVRYNLQLRVTRSQTDYIHKYFMFQEYRPEEKIDNADAGPPDDPDATHGGGFGNKRSAQSPAKQKQKKGLFGMFGSKDKDAKERDKDDKSDRGTMMSTGKNDPTHTAVAVKDGDKVHANQDAAKDPKLTRQECLYIRYIRVGDVFADLTLSGFPIFNRTGFKLMVDSYNDHRTVTNWGMLIQDIERHAFFSLANHATKNLIGLGNTQNMNRPSQLNAGMGSPMSNRATLMGTKMHDSSTPQTGNVSDLLGARPGSILGDGDGNAANELGDDEGNMETLKSGLESHAQKVNLLFGTPRR